MDFNFFDFDVLYEFFKNYGYFAVLIVLIICGLGIPIPEDLTLIAAGFVAFFAGANIHIMFVVSMLGVLLGDGLMFGAGLYFGGGILKIKFIARIITPKRYSKIQEMFDKYGNLVLFVARFLPGLRAPIYVSAGMSKKISFLQFFLLDGIAAIISVAFFVYGTHYFAKNVDINVLLNYVKKFQLGFIIIAIISAIVLFIYFYQKKKIRVMFFKKMREIIFRKNKKKDNI